MYLLSLINKTNINRHYRFALQIRVRCLPDGDAGGPDIRKTAGGPDKRKNYSIEHSYRVNV